jgi:hypothetical protein
LIEVVVKQTRLKKDEVPAVKTLYKWQKKKPTAVDTSFKVRNLLVLIIQTN